MTHEAVCITHHLDKLHPADRPRPCFQRGKHYATCADPDTCRGCVARTPSVGLLCPVCAAKATDALGRVGELICHLRSIERGGQALGERVDTSATKRLILPESWLAADSLMDALGARPIPSTASIDDTFARVADAVGDWSDFEARVSTREGAKRAVVLVKRMQNALSRFPDSEVDWRHVPVILCPNCNQSTLYRKGPLHYEDELRIQCAESHLMYDQPLKDAYGKFTGWELGYPYCEWSLDWFEFLERYSKPIEAAFEVHLKGAA